jgi:hypothetical protein
MKNGKIADLACYPVENKGERSGNRSFLQALQRLATLSFPIQIMHR